ncbi:MAG: hypothetical protein K2N03_06620, partial [Muribaculaceae bacterium]|nr:hypothetical protein [Muribaculaceae bacterium]
LGGLIYDKIALFTKELENIRKCIHSTEKAYDNCIRHLSSGPTSILARTLRMQQLGAKTTGSIAPGIEESFKLNDNSSESDLLSGESRSLEE